MGRLQSKLWDGFAYGLFALFRNTGTLRLYVLILSLFGLSVLRLAYDLLLISQAVRLSLRKDGGGRRPIEEMESILSKRQYKSVNINYYE